MTAKAFPSFSGICLILSKHSSSCCKGQPRKRKPQWATVSHPNQTGDYHSPDFANTADIGVQPREKTTPQEAFNCGLHVATWVLTKHKRRGRNCQRRAIFLTRQAARTLGTVALHSHSSQSHGRETLGEKNTARKYKTIRKTLPRDCNVNYSWNQKAFTCLLIVSPVSFQCLAGESRWSLQVGLAPLSDKSDTKTPKDPQKTFHRTNR